MSSQSRIGIISFLLGGDPPHSQCPQFQRENMVPALIPPGGPVSSLTGDQPLAPTAPWRPGKLKQQNPSVTMALENIEHSGMGRKAKFWLGSLQCNGQLTKKGSEEKGEPQSPKLK